MEAESEMDVRSVLKKYEPYRVYKSDISYFSGKLEAYLRYKSVPMTVIDADWSTLAMIGQHTGIRKMPAVETKDGQWLFDTTPTIQWFEQHYPQSPVLPDDEALAFVYLLIEDYADEWLWRPAMWWRWMPQGSRWLLGWRIAGEFISRKFARPGGWIFGWRQRIEWLWDDGMTKANSPIIRDMLFREFEFLEVRLQQTPFICGTHPSVVDFGYFASMFRHFGNDPESAEVMRRQAPHTYEWVARMWNVKPDKLAKQQSWVTPDSPEWQPLLKRITHDYLPYLHQNAIAHMNLQHRFDYKGETLKLKNTKTTTYRVWCREELQRHHRALSVEDKERVEVFFAQAGGLSSLWQDGVISAEVGKQYDLPKQSNSFKDKKVSLMTLIFGQARN